MMVRRRGDNIPSVSDYAHWNEDAKYMWYEENKYDMMYADEIIEDDDFDYKGGPEDEWPHEREFTTRTRAYIFILVHNPDNWTLHHWGDKWVVECD